MPLNGVKMPFKHPSHSYRYPSSITRDAICLRNASESKLACSTTTHGVLLSLEKLSSASSTSWLRFGWRVERGVGPAVAFSSVSGKGRKTSTNTERALESVRERSIGLNLYDVFAVLFEPIHYNEAPLTTPRMELVGQCGG